MVLHLSAIGVEAVEGGGWPPWVGSSVEGSVFELVHTRGIPVPSTGAMNAWSLLGAEALVESLVEAGSTFTRGEV
jgi:hypothetical protein